LKGRREWRAAFAVLAASAGICFSSGRETALFFSQTGGASWIGAAVASAAFGMLCGVVCRFARLTGAVSLHGVYRSVLSGRQGEMTGALYTVLTALTAGVMLVRAGELAALTLPFHNAFWMGLFSALGLAFLLNMRRMGGLSWAGVFVSGCTAAFHMALALDPRAPVQRIHVEVHPELSGSVIAAIMLAVLHAALCASVSGGVTVRYAGWIERPWYFAGKCGLLMCALLLTANWAILSGGERLLSQALPTVPLAARWGAFGYYVCICVMALCTVTTLAAAVGTLTGRSGHVSRGRYAAALTAAGIAAALTLGVGNIVGMGYPILGWACAFSLAALGCRCEAGYANHDKITC